MYFEIDISLLHQLEVRDHLHTLINICTYKRKHLVVVDNTSFDTEFYRSLSPYMQESLKASVITATYLNINSNQKNYFFVSNNIDNERTINLEQALYLSQRDFEILIENSTNDKPFIESIINSYANENSNLKNYYINGWIQFSNGGGCSNFRGFLEGHVQQYNNICGTKNSNLFLRLFAILDSDRLFEAQQLSFYQQLNEQYFLDNEIPYHILERRCMENYLPDQALKDAIGYPNSNVEWYNSYLYLNKKQKQFLDFKKGIFRGSKLQNEATKSGDLPNEVQSLYAGISHKNILNLNKGISLAKYKKEIPKGFKSHHANPKTYFELMSEQTDPIELKTIFDKIESII